MITNEIVVGFDESPSAEAALAWAVEHAKRTGCSVRAVHVFSRALGPELLAGPFLLEELVYSQTDTVPSDVRTRLSTLFETVSPRPNWRLDFLPGDPGHVLVEVSRRSHLLVVGTREHVGLGRVLLGSTSHYCLSHASCPVVAVPQPSVSSPHTEPQAPTSSAST